MNESQALRALSALSDPTRLRIVRHLVKQGDAGATAGRIADAVGASSSRSSFHLSALAQAGVLVSEKRSRHIFYRVDFPLLGDLMSFLIEDCCGGHPVVRECCQSGSKC
ncbi:MAG: metalloregulator ArsR/SmtB family transcription factor [Pseudomonadota bacterium]